ncbi:branched-chain amino acid ABC transporter permease [Bradyrhizobium quebecense]|uniref:Branched-chain amino acid ABC transporter permease n=2 Tax=Bradyrhizobium quebecense TaxID=2748629 RepID=A0ABS3MPM6_9BRAD|nr:branched-chain amino acid ABC transporter permease [Bradyrhizobium quebecense]UGY01262.1 branched-chain amino acid ABC transporter permease [Bradyrhizobium quebecense]
MQYLIQLLISGLAIGAIYGLIAMGFAVIYKSTGLVNFAQGEMTMITAYIAWTISTTVSGNVFVVAAGAILAAIVLGLVIERLVMRPMLGEPVFATVMVTIGLAVILRSAINFIWDAYPHGLDVGMGRGIVHLGGIGVRTGQIAVIVTLLLLLAAIWAFFRYSKVGVAMRAVAADDRTALLMGISATKVHGLAWAASSVIAGIGGVFFALSYDLSPAMFQLGLKAFPATILGGLDAVLGSGLGGLLIGITENLAGGYLGSGMKEVAGFAMIIVVLMIRPFGIFGERDIERV